MVNNGLFKLNQIVFFYVQSVIVCYVANMSVINVLLFSVLLGTSEAARILAVFPAPSISHQVVFRPVIQELVKRGHEVIVITADPAFPKDQTPTNLTEIDTHEESYRILREQFTNSALKGDKSNFIEQVTIIESLMVLFVEQIILKEEVRKIINDKTQKFDLVILEACAKPNLIFSHIYKVPVVQFSSFGGLATVYEPFGAPEHPILYPLAANLRLNNLTRLDKIREIYNYHRMLQLFKDHDRQIDEMYLKLFGDKIPPVAELVNNVDMLFLNIHPIFEGIRPVPPTIQYFAGLHQKPQKELPIDLQKYLDSSRNGVIYFSLGTNVDPTLLSAEKVKLFVRVLSKLPYDVLWKWNGDDLPGRTENIKISKWLPQSDLLRHPKVKVFITQGGLQSTDEAITAGVPLVGIPMLGDQWFNVERYVYHNIGVGLDFETLTEDAFRNAILKVVEDESYRKNIIKLRTLMKDEPVNSLEKSIWWIEYVIRHGGAKHLRSPGANISWTQYLELELVLIVLAVFVIALALLGTGFYAAYKYMKSYIISKQKVA